MQIFRSPLMERQIGRTQKQRDNLQEKPSGSNPSSAKPWSGLNMKDTKVIMGSGGDQATLRLGNTQAATTSESPTPIATTHTDMRQKQKELIDSINLPHVSEETKALVADIEAGVEDLRQREEALDAELAQSMKDLVQILKSPNSSDSVNGDKKSAEDSETIMEKIASNDREILTPEQQLRQRQMDRAAENATPTVAIDSKGGKQTKEPEYPAPTTDSAGHIEGYL